MGVSKKSIRANRHQLDGSLKKSGVNLWRFVFNGIESTTGLERKFFIELSMVNPGLSPLEPVLGFKTRVKISPEDLQNVLAGTASAQKIQSEALVAPSYVVVRAGVLGAGAKQLCSYHASKDVAISAKDFEIEAGRCFFSRDKLIGVISCSQNDLSVHPEYLCDAGTVSWELRYEIQYDFPKGYCGRDRTWLATGARTVFSGTVKIDGKEYRVVPKKSFGYIDRNWGRTFPESWVHFSSSCLTSLISGMTLMHSNFAVQGVYDGRVSVLSDFEGKPVLLAADAPKRAFETIWDCVQMPADQDGEKLHWSVSATNKSVVVDVDVFCPTNQLYVRSWELPEGGRRILKILCGGGGSGEIRIYRRIKRQLELLEHAHIANALCEFGQIEVPEQ